MKFKSLIVLTSLLVSTQTAQATLFSSSYGTQIGDLSNCDDCYADEYLFGTGQTIDFFGIDYSGLFVGSNGYVTFGSGASSYSPVSLDVQTIQPMIAPFFTDLDSRNDSSSNVYINTNTVGQLLITWEMMGHYPENYSARSTFQLLVRSDQLSVANGEGQIGFFYDMITDSNTVAAGFGDGLAAINTGEVAFYNGAGTGLSNSQPRWYNLEGGAPIVAPPANSVPEPAMLSLIGLGLAGLAGIRRRRGALA